MVRVKDPQFRPDVNATFGEDSAPVGRGFVPALGRLSASSLEAKPDANGKMPWEDGYSYLTPGSLRFDPTLGGALTPVRVPVGAGGTKLPTSTLLIIGGGLLALGAATYLVARASR